MNGMLILWQGIPRVEETEGDQGRMRLRGVLLISCNLGLLLLASMPPWLWQAELPQSAVVVESARVESVRHPDRLLVLWMANPHEDGRVIEPDEPYTCPDHTRGSRYLSGRAAVSLLDLRERRIINTVDLATLDLPLSIRRGVYWVKTAPGEGRPEILRLRDYNGDGKAHEFALYQADSCSLLFGTLVGYSEQRDQVLWYEVDLTVTDVGETTQVTRHWVDGLFKQGGLPGRRWVFTRSYPEENPKRYELDIRYNQEAERFQGTEVITPWEQ